MHENPYFVWADSQNVTTRMLCLVMAKVWCGFIILHSLTSNASVDKRETSNVRYWRGGMGAGGLLFCGRLGTQSSSTELYFHARDYRALSLHPKSWCCWLCAPLAGRTSETRCFPIQSGLVLVELILPDIVIMIFVSGIDLPFWSDCCSWSTTRSAEQLKIQAVSSQMLARVTNVFISLHFPNPPGSRFQFPKFLFSNFFRLFLKCFNRNASCPDIWSERCSRIEFLVNRLLDRLNTITERAKYQMGTSIPSKLGMWMECTVHQWGQQSNREARQRPKADWGALLF